MTPRRITILWIFTVVCLCSTYALVHRYSLTTGQAGPLGVTYRLDHLTGRTSVSVDALEWERVREPR